MKILKKKNNILLAEFEKKFITKSFIKALNNKSINKFLDVKKTRQNKKTAVKYYEERKKKWR